MPEQNARPLRILGDYLAACLLDSRFSTRKDLLHYQEENLRAFFRHTLSRSPFYQRYSFDDFHQIPVISKKGMLENFDDMNTAGLKRREAISVALRAEESRNFSSMIGEYTVGLSSGTSGSRGIFVASRREREKWAGIMLAKSIGRTLWRARKVALFLRSNSNLYESLGTGGHITFRYFDITCPLNTHADILSAYQPDILTAPASILRHLAHMQESGIIAIQPSDIFSGAEVLDPLDQVYIERIFKKPVRQIYQCTEGFLGITAQNGRFCLNEEYVLVEKEYVDREAGLFVPLITDFTRTTQPIVRYRLDDVLVEDKACDGARTALKRIEGRCDDIFYFISRSGKPVPVFSDALRQTLLSAGVDYRHYQLRQTGPENMELRILPKLSHDEEQLIMRAFSTLYRRYNCQPAHVAFLPYDIDSGPQKLRRICRTWDMGKGRAA